MTYTVTLKDKQTFVVSGYPAKEMVLAAMASGSPVGLNGTAVSGSMIATVQDGDATRRGEYGPHLNSGTQDRRSLPEAVDTKYHGLTFWQYVVYWNERKLHKHGIEDARPEGFPWVFNLAVRMAKSESGYSDPQHVLAFLVSEWERLDRYNSTPKAKLDHEGRKLVKEYLSSEKGAPYAETVASNGW